MEGEGRGEREREGEENGSVRCIPEGERKGGREGVHIERVLA